VPVPVETVRMALFNAVAKCLHRGPACWKSFLNYVPMRQPTKIWLAAPTDTGTGTSSRLAIGPGFFPSGSD
jgi:hypothetical protein